MSTPKLVSTTPNIGKEACEMLKNDPHFFQLSNEVKSVYIDIVNRFPKSTKVLYKEASVAAVIETNIELIKFMLNENFNEKIPSYSTGDAAFMNGVIEKLAQVFQSIIDDGVDDFLLQNGLTQSSFLKSIGIIEDVKYMKMLEVFINNPMAFMKNN